MKFLQINKILTDFLFISILLLQSCALNHGNAKLSDALNKSSNNNSGSRKVKGSVYKVNNKKDSAKKSYLCKDILKKNNNFHKNNNHELPKNIAVKNSSSKTIVAFKAGSGFLTTNDLYGISHFSFSKGKYDYKNKKATLFSFGFSNSPIQQTSHLNESLSGGISILNLGGIFRKYKTPAHTFLGNYLLLGGNLDFMFWQYQNTIYVDEYDEDGFMTTISVNSDALGGLDFFGGVGFNLIQTKTKHIGFEVTPGITIWSPITTQGFTNDYFPPYFYVKIGIIFNFIGNK